MHLYVHVPFCLRRCSYCDFAISVRRTAPAEAFVRAVLTERALRAEPEGWGGARFETVYLGGGTPSHLPADAVARLLAAFPVAPGAEVTLEANPEDVTGEAARAWHAAGVSRVSLGVQSFEPAVLAWMHRAHGAEAPARAVRALRESGPFLVSLDLIFALPDELGHQPARDLDRALALEPDHISAYGLTLEPRTPYARWVSRGHATVASDDRFAGEFLLVHRRLTAAGFEHYEVSNYARRDDTGGASRRAAHNAAYWTGRPYVGLGPAAHGYDGARRRWNRRAWTDYERTVAAGLDPVEGSEELTDAQRHLERVYLALRTAHGLGDDLAGTLAPNARLAAARAGWLTEADGRLTPTPEGWVVLDEVVRLLTTSREGG